MTTAAAKGDYSSGIAIGDKYLHSNPGDTNVLEQTAILCVAQAKQDQRNREMLLDRSVILLERSVKSSDATDGTAARLANRLVTSRAFESVGDLSSHKCTNYKRALALDNEAAIILHAESVKLDDGREMSTAPLMEQTTKLKSELEQRIASAQCVN